MLDTQSFEVVWRVLATHSIRQFPFHLPSRASPCAISFQLDSTTQKIDCLWSLTGESKGWCTATAKLLLALETGRCMEAWSLPNRNACHLRRNVTERSRINWQEYLEFHGETAWSTLQNQVGTASSTTLSLKKSAVHFRHKFYFCFFLWVSQ